MIKDCLVCKKTFYCRPCHIDRAKYCSVKCHNIDQLAKPITDEENLKIIKKNYEKRVKIEEDGCWNWNGAFSGGGYSVLCDGRQNNITGHRASWMLHKGPIINSLFVLHTCDNRKCTNPQHLFLGTAKDNIRDAFNKGRLKNLITSEMTKGENHHNSKLQLAEVIKIKKILKNSNEKLKKISSMFGVTSYTISDIKRGKTWSHVRIE